MMVAAVILLEPLQKFFGARPFVWLGEISYSFYLVHFPVIATVGCGLFETLYGKMSYLLATLIVFAVTTVLTVGISMVSRKYIESLRFRVFLS